MSEEVLARVSASPPRRWFAMGVMTGLGALLLYLALAAPPGNPAWLAFLVGMAGASLWLAVRMWQATALDIVLTESGLYDSEGTELARFNDIASVDRGMFAMKPSNGFLVRLSRPAPRGWRPGLWWRLGKRLAVGGVTSAAQTKPMADILTVRLAQRDAG